MSVLELVSDVVLLVDVVELVALVEKLLVEFWVVVLLYTDALVELVVVLIVVSFEELAGILVVLLEVD